MNYSAVKWLELNFEALWTRYGRVLYSDEIITYSMNVVEMVDNGDLPWDYRPAGNFIGFKKLRGEELNELGPRDDDMPSGNGDRIHAHGSCGVGH